MTEKINSNGVEITRVDPKGDSRMLRNLAEIYAEVFAGPPWNEFTICPSSGEFFGKETKVGQKCPDCSSKLLPAYPLDETEKYILPQ